MATIDLVVWGCGGVGSAALSHAARRRLRVLGIEQFGAAHDRGSSHGETRIIRQAYFEHADYVPLALSSYQQWHALEARAKRQLLFPTGLVQVGPPSGAVVCGVRLSAARHGLEVETLDSRQANERWPGMVVPEGETALFEPAAGYLRVEDCVRAHLTDAQLAGANLWLHCGVRSWRQRGEIIVLETDRGTVETAALVIAAGPWAKSALGALRAPFVPKRKPVFWFEPSGDRYDAANGFPAFLHETPDGVFYGFPAIDSRGVKCAEHSGGETIADLDQVDRSLRLADRERVARFLQTALPGVSPRMTGHSVCIYTMSPDEHFILDRHPDASRVAFAAGLSGHGFKFAPVLGQALVDLAVEGRTSLPIEFLSLRRFDQK